MGEGVIDFTGVVRFLQQTGYQGWIMVEDECPRAEHDPDGATAHNGAYVREHADAAHRDQDLPRALACDRARICMIPCKPSERQPPAVPDQWGAPGGPQPSGTNGCTPCLACRPSVTAAASRTDARASVSPYHQGTDIMPSTRLLGSA
jgi:hypothetical protein